MQSEADLQREVLDLLEASGILHFRVPLGGVKHGGVRKKSPMKGFPDIAGYCPNGKGWTMELKTVEGKLSPDQLEWYGALLESRVMAFIIRSLDDAAFAVQKILNSVV